MVRIATSTFPSTAPLHSEENDMLIKVTRCWNGKRTIFTLTTSRNEQELICALDDAGGPEEWTRERATQALDTFETLYGYKRRNIRFDTAAA
jgi:hypothetical protein